MRTLQVVDEHLHSTGEDYSPTKMKQFKYKLEDCLTSGPVLNATNSMNPLYLCTYIADISLCHPNAKLLMLYKKQQNLRNQVRSAFGCCLSSFSIPGLTVALLFCAWHVQIREKRAVMKKAKNMRVKMPPAQQRVFDRAGKRLSQLEKQVAQYDSQFGKLYSTNVSGCSSFSQDHVLKLC